jgi:hypothetical protein
MVGRMSLEVLVALIGAVATLGGAGLTYFGTRRTYESRIKELQQERQHERERGFEQAQIGYRALYEKFRKHFAETERTGEGLGRLNDDREEILSVGFKPVCDALEQFWPDGVRRAGEPPIRDKLAPLEAAMRLHGSMRLLQLDQMRERGEA